MREELEKRSLTEVLTSSTSRKPGGGLQTHVEEVRGEVGRVEVRQ